ncbi:hypothetical protein RFI_29413 [Reticulomyxa filosa]|uniref:Trichohyalin n=1 Tax=Reticulomyxa filosa TaxID=46433 RepID=X6M284_RETFI|nr:hypothetical protein RFI_29413 [Reticulomyxa filosa]|eukprot:ETO07979.1 hypothetical protein RFI_29413 [Reticulomyxa filosa]
MHGNQKFYKNGRLTDAAREKLNQRLKEENAKAQNLSNEYGNNQSKVSQKNCEKSYDKSTNYHMLMTPNEQLEATEIPRPQTQTKQQAQDEHDLNWVSLTAYNQKMFEAEERLQKKTQKVTTEKTRKMLVGQITEQQQQREKEEQEREKYRKELQMKYRADDEEFKKQQLQTYEKTQQLKQAREKEIQQLGVRRRREERKLHQHEIYETHKFEEELKQTKKSDDLKRVQEMVALQRMLHENEKQKLIKEEERQNEEKEAVRLQKIHAKMLEEQEKSREKQLQATYNKYQKKVEAVMATFSSTNTYTSDAVVAKELKIRQQAEDEKIRANEKKRKHEMLNCHQILVEQIKEKQKNLREEIQKDRDYGKMLKEDVQLSKQQFEEERKTKLQKTKEQSRYLQRQIRYSGVKQICFLYIKTGLEE